MYSIILDLLKALMLLIFCGSHSQSLIRNLECYSLVIVCGETLDPRPAAEDDKSKAEDDKSGTGNDKSVAENNKNEIEDDGL